MGTQSRIAMQVIENSDIERQEGIVTTFRHHLHDRESLSENFLDELDAWVRQAMALDGFSN